MVVYVVKTENITQHIGVSYSRLYLAMKAAVYIEQQLNKALNDTSEVNNSANVAKTCLCDGGISAIV